MHPSSQVAAVHASEILACDVSFYLPAYRATWLSRDLAGSIPRAEDEPPLAFRG